MAPGYIQFVGSLRSWCTSGHHNQFHWVDWASPLNSSFTSSVDSTSEYTYLIQSFLSFIKYDLDEWMNAFNCPSSNHHQLSVGVWLLFFLPLHTQWYFRKITNRSCELPSVRPLGFRLRSHIFITSHMTLHNLVLAFFCSAAAAGLPALQYLPLPLLDFSTCSSLFLECFISTIFFFFVNFTFLEIPSPIWIRFPCYTFWNPSSVLWKHML